MDQAQGVRDKLTPLEPDPLDAMITSLAERLEGKGVITQEEWEQRIKKNLES
jgi:hypothetical protein